MAGWLNKYEQGGLVLKKKTKDNYGKKANPNDVQASVGPDFVGLGYDIKGRDYSPAWGGQFQNGGKTYKSKPMAESSDVNTVSNTVNVDDFSNYATVINRYANMGNDTSYMYTHNTPKGTEQFFHNTNQGKPVSQLQRGNQFINLSPEQVNAYKQKVLKGTGGFEDGGILGKRFLKTYDEFAMGGSLPGSVGFTYARTQDPAPSNGKYAKKTLASAQNGQEMKFYQDGLDFKPKTISQNGSVIKDDRGQWAYPGEITEIGSNDITMQGVDYPVLGVSDTGDTQMMYPDQDYKFDGEKVTEYPMAQLGKNIPTQADSLALYNNSKQVMDYYKKRKYDNTDNIILKDRNLKNFYKSLDSSNEKWAKNNLTGSGTTVPTKNETVKNLTNLPESIYRKVVDENKVFQRETADGILDTRAPMQLYDRRIAPTQRSFFNNRNPKDILRDDFVEINTYDPVLIKPVSMLTPKEKELRIKRYGKNSGIKETVSKPIQKPVSKPTPKPEPAPVVAKQSAPEKPTPQPKSLYDYEGESVMAPTPGGGGSAMVGVRKKDGTVEYIRPEDYQRMGVPKYGQDYIKSKQKMKEGGWLNKYK